MNEQVLRQKILTALDAAFTPDPGMSRWRVDAEQVRTLVEALVLLDGNNERREQQR